jgi:hypothetical protein
VGMQSGARCAPNPVHTIHYQSFNTRRSAALTAFLCLAWERD